MTALAAERERNRIGFPHNRDVHSLSARLTLQTGVRFFYLDNAALLPSSCTRLNARGGGKLIPFLCRVCFKESVLCKWTKYGNLSKRKGVLAALFQIYTLLFLKKICSCFNIQWLGGVKYISLIVTQIWTHL